LTDLFRSTPREARRDCSMKQNVESPSSGNFVRLRSLRSFELISFRSLRLLLDVQRDIVIHPLPEV